MSIQHGTFENCSALQSLYIPGSINQIEQFRIYSSGSYDYTFNGCTSLKKLTIEYGSTTLYSGYCSSSSGFVSSKWYDWINTLEYLSIDRELNYSMTPTALKELTLGEHMKSRALTPSYQMKQKPKLVATVCKGIKSVRITKGWLSSNTPTVHTRNSSITNTPTQSTRMKAGEQWWINASLLLLIFLE